MTMSKIQIVITIAALSLVMGGCDKKEEAKAAPTMEQIQAQKGKPAHVAKAQKQLISDIRSFNGSVEGMQQTNAVAKMSDPIKSIKVNVGSSVAKDQVLAEFTYTGDNTKYQQAEEQVKLLESTTERLRTVYEKGGLSKQDLDQSETQLRIAKLTLETDRRTTVVLAPASGVITDVRFKEGQVPKVGDVMFTVAKLDNVILKPIITSRDIGLFKKGLTATVILNGDTVTGKVTLVPMAADPQTRFFPVEITFNNKGRHLLPGMFVTTEIVAKKLEAIAVPNGALVYTNGINYVWTVVDGKAKRNIVQLGVAGKESTQILSGIELNDTIMLDGMSKMNDGDKVLVLE